MRILRIESFRLYTIFVVAAFHTQFLIDIDQQSALITLLRRAFIDGARFAMPFFFIVSGYFIGGKIVRDPENAITVAKSYIKRLLLVFIFWSVIYALEIPLQSYDFTYGIIRPICWLVKQDPIKVIFAGTRGHLWFLVSLMLTILLFAIWPTSNRSKHFLLFGIVLFSFGLLIGPYKATPVGLNVNFNMKYGILFSTLFFSIGVAFSNTMPRVSMTTALCIAFIGLIISWLEAFFLWHNWLVDPDKNDYLLGTVPLGVGVSMLAFTNRNSTIDLFVGQYGKYVLGIYVCHMIFIDLLRPCSSLFGPIVWQFVFPIIVFGSSLVTTIIMSRTRLRRVFV